MDHDVLHLGLRDAWGGAEVPFGVADDDLARHLFVLGKTGTGKSTLLKSLVLQKIAAGEGVALLDPHGDLTDEVLDYIPRCRFDDIVHFDPADRDYPIGFNPLARVAQHDRERVASGFVAALRSVWRDYFGPRMEYILHATILALLECQNVTVLAIQRLLTDRHYLLTILRQVKDPVVRRFFEYEYLRWDDHFRQEAVSSILNKTGQLILAPMVRNTLGQVRRRIDCRFMMDRKRILIANLAKGRMGEDVSSLMGSLLVTCFSQAAMTRVDVPVADRVPFTLVVDEFATFVCVRPTAHKRVMAAIQPPAASCFSLATSPYCSGRNVRSPTKRSPKILIPIPVLR